jgi:hypothetical protein
MEKHVNVVAALLLGLSIIGIAIALFAGTILGVIGSLIDDPVASRVLPIIASVIIWIVIILSLPGIVAGIGLFRKQEWARILALILSVIRLLNIPIGTAIGGYSIWVLVQDETVSLFKPHFKKHKNGIN